MAYGHPLNSGVMRKSDSGPYDLDLIEELCVEEGLECGFEDRDTLAIYLSKNNKICFINNVVTHRMGQPTLHDDSMITFSGSNGGHTHLHEFEFVDNHGHYVSMHYLDVISGISSGDILIGEIWNNGELKDSWFVHRKYNNEFEDMEEGDEIRVYRITPKKK